MTVGQNGTIRTSLDAITWTSANVPGLTATLDDCTYFGGRHYVVGSIGVILSSENASNWDFESAGTQTRRRTITTNGVHLVAAGENGEIVVSADGDTLLDSWEVTHFGSIQLWGSGRRSGER